MKVLAIYFVYNEIKHLPLNIEFWRRQGVDVYVIDNYSNDGTWEWLQDNGIPSHRFDTNESFDLKALQGEASRVVNQIKPDWVVMGAADLYYLTDFGLKETFTYLESKGYNQVELMCWMMKSTGEEFALPFWNHFFYGDRWTRLVMISKYYEGLTFAADKIVIDNPNIAFIEGIVVNYGGCKPIEDMEVKLARRKKAWDNGLNKDWGYHYREDKAKGWVYKKHELEDVRLHEEKKYIEKLCTILS
jgi:glycosyltransferase involved in cell wall biosynthesis